MSITGLLGKPGGSDWETEMKDTDVSFATSLTPLGKTAWLQSPPRSSDPLKGILVSGLSIAEKREILSSWASDARAVPDSPALRRLDNGAMVVIDDILDALRTLDVSDLEENADESTTDPERRPTGWWIQAVRRRRPPDDDDDDPPPCPAVIAPVPRLPPFGAELALEAA